MLSENDGEGEKLDLMCGRFFIAPIERTILGSDLGQAWNCSPVEGFRQTIAMLIDLGYSEPEIRKLTSGNACALTGLE